MWRWSAPAEAHVPLFTSTQRAQLNTYGLAVSGDGCRAVVLVSEAREDHGLWMHQRQLVRVIATETGATVATLDAGRFEVDSLPVVSWDGAMVVLRSDDGRARVWRTGEDAAAKLEGGARGRVVRLVVSRDGTRAVTVSEGGALTPWDNASGRVVRELPHTGAVPCVAFAPDGASVVAGLSGGPSGMALGVWRVGDGGWLSLAPGDAEVRSLHTSEDGARLATTHADGSAAVWSLPSGTRLLRVHAAGKAVTDAAMSPDGGRLATACDDRTAAVWTIRPTGPMLAPLDAGAPVTGLTFSADGARLAVTTDAAPVRVWDLRERTPPLALRGDGAIAPRVQFTPDGARLLTLHEDGVGVWGARDGARVAWRTADHGDAVGWSVSADARVASRLDDSRVAVWRLGDDSAPVELAAVRPSVSRALLSPDGALVATLHADHVSTWSAVDGHPLATFALAPTTAHAPAFSPDSAMVLTSGGDGVVRVSDARSGRLVRELRGHAEAVTELAFSTDGALLATASADGAVRLWDGRVGTPRATLHGHDGEVNSLMFSPDHARLFTVGVDNVARVWSTEDGRLSGLLRWRGERARRVHLAADGLHAAVAYVEGAAELVELDPVAAWRTGCALLRDGPLWRDRPRLRDACAGAAP